MCYKWGKNHNHYFKWWYVPALQGHITGKASFEPRDYHVVFFTQKKGEQEIAHPLGL